MISGKDIYDVLAAIVPLYVAMILAYGSVRWWKIYTPSQCSGINRFVAVFAVPLLSFHFISSNDPYAMNYRFIAADSLQKVVILGALFLWQALSKRGNLEWMITLFSLSTLPNTLVMGIPLLKAMYGDFSGNLMVQIRVQYDCGSITSFRVDSDVVSLNGREPLQADAEIGDDGKLHVMVRRSGASSVVSSFKSHGRNSLTSITPRASNLTGCFYAMFASKAPSPKHEYFGDVYSLQSSKGPTARTSNFDDDMLKKGKKRGGRVTYSTRDMSGELFNNGGLVPAYSPPIPTFSGSSTSDARRKKETAQTASPVSEGNLNCADSSKAGGYQQENAVSKAMQELIGKMSPGGKLVNGEKGMDLEDESSKLPTSGSPFTYQKKVDIEGELGTRKNQMPPASVMTRLILIMVWRKLIRNPNSCSSLLGVVWSLISFRWDIQMPSIISGSIAILSNAGLGMAMFLTGPAVIAATSIAVGLRGVLLHVAVVQSALPQGIVRFVFAKEYNVHPDVLSTAVIFGMLIALPITILYYVLLGI
ncbi:hypothetical protein K2173_016233 [Erythroxylum novogranatense]|uniref:Auxin efflux carrier component n=1 Tax=Erythroxylum novogranatense TaxID=1862640 RepID=A0AAV8SFT5_9ROSI|nr:hypothetical protein K2173_016233 [Erythroxylum novogranatense]